MALLSWGKGVGFVANAQYQAGAVLNYPRRLVLDTNVVLDWLVFANADALGLTAAEATGGVQVMLHQAMLDELTRVLGYPLLKLDESRRAEVLASYRAQGVQAGVPKAFNGDHLMLPEGFPRCRDPDDQVFLAVAYHAQAALVSRDKAVLKLIKRAGRFGVQIISPPQLSAWLAAG